MNRFVSMVAALAIAAFLNGCGSKASSADAPPDFKAVGGDSSVTITWTAAPDVEYWIFYARGSNVTSTNWLSIGGAAISKVTSPHTVGGLVNGTTYSFTMNGRKNGGPGGTGAPTQVLTPRLAGANWVVNAPLGSARLNGAGATSTTRTAVGAGGVIYSLPVGGTVATQTNPSAPAALNAVLNGGLGFAAVGNAGTVIFTSDALTWTTKTSNTVADLYALASPATGAFTAYGAAGTVISSADGSTWTTGISGTTKNLYGAIYGGARYVAVGAEGTIITSTDGTTWQTVATATARDLRTVTFGALVNITGTTTTTTNQFVALGTAGTLLTSTDGLTWTLQPPISTSTINAAVYGGQFVAVGTNGAIYTSADGVAWQSQVSGTTSELTAIARTATGYIVVGAAGTYLTSQ